MGLHENEIAIIGGGRPEEKGREDTSPFLPTTRGGSVDGRSIVLTPVMSESRTRRMAVLAMLLVYIHAPIKHAGTTTKETTHWDSYLKA